MLIGREPFEALRSTGEVTVTDMLGLMIGPVVHAASVQDRDGAPALLKSIRARRPRLRHVFAEGG